MTKLEEVARAIAAQSQDLAYERCPKHWHRSARAAIKALMNHKPPTVCMVSKTYDYNIGPQDAQQIWQSWLQTILDEERKRYDARSSQMFKGAGRR